MRYNCRWPNLNQNCKKNDKMKNTHLFMAFAGFLMLLHSCASNKVPTPHEKTLAQVCADSFPCIDSIQLIECEVDVKESKLVYVDSTECPPSDTGKLLIETKIITVPEYKIKTVVMAPAQIDSALKQAYRDLQSQYKITIKALEDCKTSQKQKAKPPKQDWKVWLIAIGLLVIVVTQVFSKRFG